MSSPCRYVEGWGYYLRSHELNCRDITCVGCQPCTHEDSKPVRHCSGRERCTSHLDAAHPKTCPRCVGRTRKQIAEIDVWHERDLLLEAYQAGIESEAAMLAGPAADPSRPLPACHIEALDDDAEHPLTVLGTWALNVRDTYNHGTPERTTVTSAAAYLRRMLSDLAQIERFDWRTFAGEINTCHAHLTTVLHIARRTERGAPCPSCNEAPPLIKHYRNKTAAGWPDLTGASDFWACPVCGAEWLEAEYRLRVADDYLDNAAELPASEIARLYDVPESTVRRWANEDPPRVRKRGFDGHRRQLYDVADVNNALATRLEIPAGLHPQESS